MVRFGFLFATGTGGGFVRTQRTPPPYGPDDSQEERQYLTDTGSTEVSVLKQAKKDIHKCCCRDCFPCIPARYVLSVMGSLGFLIVYALRVNMSVALVAMVNETASSSGPHKRAGSNGSTVFSSCQPTAPVFNWGPEDQGGRKLRYSTCSICGESRLNLSLPRRHSVSVICKPPPSFMSALYLYSFPRLGIVLFLLRLHPHSNSRRLLGHSFQWQACLWFGRGPHVSPHPVDTSCCHHQHLALGGT